MVAYGCGCAIYRWRVGRVENSRVAARKTVRLEDSARKTSFGDSVEVESARAGADSSD